MNAVDEEFLLGLAGVSATLLGTFIVGVFFYIDSDMHRRLASSQATDVYLRSGTRWVFTAYSIPLFVPLLLAAVDPTLGRDRVRRPRHGPDHIDRGYRTSHPGQWQIGHVPCIRDR
ncbi:hypothetical protein [Actinomadura sp. 9N407]|uniref:hypothetical protein n=1 Tax=Actinomadura sp. 9N407 TaxID=3375154 RepID=UPI003793FC82